MDLEFGSTWMDGEEGGACILGIQPALEERALNPETEDVGLNLSSTFASQHDQLMVNSFSIK